MKRRLNQLLLTIAAVLFYSLCFGQTWHTRYNYLYLTDFEQLHNSNILLTGYRYGAILDSANIILINADSVGNVIWSKSYGSNRNEYSTNVVQTADSGYVMAGTTNGFTSNGNDVMVIKVDQLGNVLWSKAYGGDYEDRAGKILPTPDGGFIIAGTTTSLTIVPTETDFFLLSLDSAGNLRWINTYGDGDNNEFSNVVLTSDSNHVVIIGTTGNFAGNGFINNYLIKTDLNGNKMWEKAFGVADIDYNYYGKQSLDGGFVVCGSINTIGSGDMYVMKTDSSGDVLWGKNYGSLNERNDAYNIALTHDSGYIVTGTTFIQGGSVVSIIKLDKNGDTLWTTTDAETIYDGGGQAEVTENGYLIESVSSLFKIDSMGNTNCNSSTLNYTYSNLTVSNYTTHAHLTQPLWNNVRNVTVDTSTGVTSTPGCIGLGVMNASNNTRQILTFPIPSADGSCKITFPLASDNVVNVQVWDNNHIVTSKQYPIVSNNGNSFIEYFPPHVLKSGIYFIQLVFTDHIETVKLIVCN